jgi:hypothetical protein
MSSLMGVDATVGAFSADVELGILRNVNLALRAELPIDSHRVAGSFATSQLYPGTVGLGLVVPLTAPRSFIIPRLGGGFGVVWVHATGTNEFTVQSPGSSTTTTEPTSGNGITAAGYVTAALSMRVYGPLRISSDGLLGATAARLVVRGGGETLAYWGRPYGALGIHAEIVLP